MEQNIPELLLDLARDVRLYRKALIVPTEPMGEQQFRQVKLALDLLNKSAEFRLRAMVERWSIQRLVREMY